MTRRIPYAAAEARLRALHPDVTPGEIALWVAGFVDGAQLAAYPSSLDDDTPLSFQAGIGMLDPKWLDYEGKLSRCFFDERAVESFRLPAQRFIPFNEAARLLSEAAPGVRDPAAFFIAMIENDEIQCAHPIAGVPDLDDRGQVEGALLPIAEVEAAIAKYFPSRSTDAGALPGSSIVRNVTAGSGGPRVYWRVVLFDRIQEIDEANGGRAKVMDVIRFLRRMGDPRIKDDGPKDVILWIDDAKGPHVAKKSTVQTAISEARRAASARA